MTSLPINHIPAEILDRFHTDRIVLISNERLGNRVLGSTDLDPASLREIDGLESLSELREREGVYSITTTILRLTPEVIEQAAEGFERRAEIITELNALLQREQQVYVGYVVTHFNHRPLEELTVFIGGDCYRTGKEIKDLESILSRTKDLAKAMIRKAVLVFPDIPTLHGGKKGEWIIVDRTGKKIDGISEDAIIALGTVIIPVGITFINRYKERQAQEKGIYDSFPAQNVMRPDTASPDVLSGPNWKTMCEAWARRNFDLSFVTCLPSDLGGPIDKSSRPTGYGAATTAMKLVEHRFANRDRGQIRFLLEALGGVGRATTESLIRVHGIAPDQITGFDISPEACAFAAEQYGIRTVPSSSSDFYDRLGDGQHYDVWINNGEGDDTGPEQIQKLLDAGVRIFCGAANNFLKLTDDEDRPEELKRQSLQRIFDAGGWAWPDEATSGGGWTLAVIDVVTRAKGENSNTDAARQQILDTIISRNEKLVDTVVRDVSAGGPPTGQAVWDRVESIINERVAATLDKEFAPSEILAAADVTQWRLA